MLTPSSLSNPTVSNLDPTFIGDSAAVITACLWTGSSILFTTAGRRIGFFSVNAFRSLMAVVLLVLAHIFLLGSVLPAVNDAQWFWMGLSGIIGLGIGDFGLFAAYVLIGPRRSTLVMASSPIFASIGAYIMLGETFSYLATFGIAITIAGIVVVLIERENERLEATDGNKRKTWGIFAAFVAALGQGVGLVLSKKGMYVGAAVAMNPVSAALIRMTVATLFVWTCALFLKRLPELQKTTGDKEGLKYVAGGTIIGPFVGMTLSMFAVTYTATGIAQTLMSLMPLIIIPLMWVVYKEKTNLRGILGAAFAVVGVAILFIA
jgi:drug/metabolite transporter (DMT)-like permease